MLPRTLDAVALTAAAADAPAQHISRPVGPTVIVTSTPPVVVPQREPSPPSRRTSLRPTAAGPTPLYPPWATGFAFTSRGTGTLSPTASFLSGR